MMRLYREQPQQKPGSLAFLPTLNPCPGGNCVLGIFGEQNSQGCGISE